MNYAPAGLPFLALDQDRIWMDFGIWPCQWIGHSDMQPPFVGAFRRQFTLPHPALITIHVSADERYDLYLDGQRIGQSVERGGPRQWPYETYTLDLTAGPHVLVARVWALGEGAPMAQMSARPGFILAPPDPAYLPLLATGVAAWEVKRLGGYTFVSPNLNVYCCTGDTLDLDGAAYDWGFETGGGAEWGPVVNLERGASAARGSNALVAHLLVPAALPPQRVTEQPAGAVRFVGALTDPDTHSQVVRAADHLASEAAEWAALLRGEQRLTVPPHTGRRIIVDMQDYACSFAYVIVTGGRGGLIQLTWAESLFADERLLDKGDRNAVLDKYVYGKRDRFRPDGGAARRFEPWAWHAGRYLEVVVQAEADPLTLDRLQLFETHYPLNLEVAFTASDTRLPSLLPMLTRTLLTSSHENFIDPYYEQMTYAGDARVQALTTYLVARDDRLQRKALELFDASRGPLGLTQSRYPSRQPQTIPPFSLWWVGMVHDFALWRGDRRFMARLLPGVRAVLDAFDGFRNADGLVEAPPGWNFMDWVPGWRWGVPPSGDWGASSLINWQYVWVLSQAGALEAWCGEPEMAARHQRRAGALAERLCTALWNEPRGLFADDLTHTAFSEHAQCLALLSGHLPPALRSSLSHALLADAALTLTSLYFTHYLFEAYYALGRVDRLLARLDPWYELQRLGFKTTVENMGGSPEPWRSDCHAWGTHPLYHFLASVLGVRPGGLGFSSVIIAPQLGGLTAAAGQVVHPAGLIEVDLHAVGASLRATVALPDGVSGVLRWAGADTPLHPGRQTLELPQPKDTGLP